MAQCRCCGKVITTADVCLYVRGRVFHADCYARLLAPPPLEHPNVDKLPHEPGDVLIAACAMVIGYRQDETLLLHAKPEQGGTEPPIIDAAAESYRK